MKKTPHYCIGLVPISNRNIVEKEKMQYPNTQMHCHSLSWLNPGTSIKGAGVKFAF